MSAQAVLTQAINQWERRRRWGVIAEVLPYALMPGLFAGTFLALYARLRVGLPDTVSVGVAVAGVVMGVVGLFIWVWVIRTRPPLESARWFDRRFDLQERVSTALELIEGRIQTDGVLKARQIADAERLAGEVKPAAMLPLWTDWRIWAMNLGLIVALAFLLLFVPPVTASADEAAREREAIAEAAEDVSDIISQIAANPDLTDEQRAPLLEALQSQLETLREPNLTLDEALAALSEAQSTLSEAAADLQTSLDQQARAEAAASSAMQPFSQADNAVSLEETISGVQENLDNLSADEMQEAAGALEQAADALEQTDPDTAGALRDAASALREGDASAADSALSEAAAGAERAEARRGEQQRQQSTLQQNAQQAQTAMSQAAQQTPQAGEQQGQSTEGQQNAQPSDSQGNSGDGSSGEFGSEGDTPAEGANAASPSDSGQQTDSNSGANGRGSEGAGDGEGDLTQDATGSGRNSGGEDSSTAPSAQTLQQRQYQAIFAPQFSVEAAGDDEIRLNADPGEELPTQDDRNDNPAGVSVVPYNQVFSDYANAASRALESDYIPLGMRDAVRQYFSSLDPQR